MNSFVDLPDRGNSAGPPASVRPERHSIPPSARRPRPVSESPLHNIATNGRLMQRGGRTEWSQRFQGEAGSAVRRRAGNSPHSGAWRSPGIHECWDDQTVPDATGFWPRSWGIVDSPQPRHQVIPHIGLRETWRLFLHRTPEVPLLSQMISCTSASGTYGLNQLGGLRPSSIITKVIPSMPISVPYSNSCTAAV
jgi:hypothetical protein